MPTIEELQQRIEDLQRDTERDRELDRQWREKHATKEAPEKATAATTQPTTAADAAWQAGFGEAPKRQEGESFSDYLNRIGGGIPGQDWSRWLTDGL